MSQPRSAIRPAILAEVTVRPGQTSYAIASGLGYQGQDRIGRRHHHPHVARRGAHDRDHVRAPAGTPGAHVLPGPASPPELVRRKPAAPPRRPVLARLRPSGPVMSMAESASAACRRADPALFFGRDGEPAGDRALRVAEAREVCFACPVRVACLNAATARRELWGVWGGTDFETGRVQRATQTTRPAAVTAGRA